MPNPHWPQQLCQIRTFVLASDARLAKDSSMAIRSKRGVRYVRIRDIVDIIGTPVAERILVMHAWSGCCSVFNYVVQCSKCFNCKRYNSIQRY